MLSLNENRIQQLPPTMGQLKALRTLNLSGNQISEFPSGLGTLRHLDLLDLSRNKIQNVPSGVSELQAIEINLNQNQVTPISQSSTEDRESPTTATRTIPIAPKHSPTLLGSPQCSSVFPNLLTLPHTPQYSSTLLTSSNMPDTPQNSSKLLNTSHHFSPQCSSVFPTLLSTLQHLLMLLNATNTPQQFITFPLFVTFLNVTLLNPSTGT